MNKILSLLTFAILLIAGNACKKGTYDPIRDSDSLKGYSITGIHNMELNRFTTVYGDQNKLWLTIKTDETNNVGQVIIAVEGLPQGILYNIGQNSGVPEFKTSISFEVDNDIAKSGEFPVWITLADSNNRKAYFPITLSLSNSDINALYIDDIYLYRNFDFNQYLPVYSPYIKTHLDLLGLPSDIKASFSNNDDYITNFYINFKTSASSNYGTYPVKLRITNTVEEYSTEYPYRVIVTDSTCQANVLPSYSQCIIEDEAGNLTTSSIFIKRLNSSYYYTGGNCYDVNIDAHRCLIRFNINCNDNSISIQSVSYTNVPPFMNASNRYASGNGYLNPEDGSITLNCTFHLYGERKESHQYTFRIIP